MALHVILNTWPLDTDNPILENPGDDPLLFLIPVFCELCTRNGHDVTPFQNLLEHPSPPSSKPKPT